MMRCYENAHQFCSPILRASFSKDKKTYLSALGVRGMISMSSAKTDNCIDLLKIFPQDKLFLVTEELGLDIPQNPKIIVLKKLIESREIFETDKEFLQSVIDGVLAEKNAKIEQEKFKLDSEKGKIEFEKIKLEQLKKELELTNARCKLSPAQGKRDHFESVPSDIENLIKSIKTLTIK
ncbi:hypothetical protein TNCV_2144761 [Trichonephila clavipes]|nr:hypothetical protein TNCV_2144761 [Trichonephila clavipes]